MFDFKYYIEMYGLNRQLKRIDKVHAADVLKARKESNNPDKIEELKRDYFTERRFTEDLIAGLMSRRLYRQANRYYVSIPPHSDQKYWEESFVTGGYVLTKDGIATLRENIRKEQNARWQFWELRLRVLGFILPGITGLVGALIGLIALWGK